MDVHALVTLTLAAWVVWETVLPLVSLVLPAWLYPLPVGGIVYGIHAFVPSPVQDLCVVVALVGLARAVAGVSRSAGAPQAVRIPRQPRPGARPDLI